MKNETANRLTGLLGIVGALLFFVDDMLFYGHWGSVRLTWKGHEFLAAARNDRQRLFVGGLVGPIAERANVFAIVEELKRAGLICCVLSNTISLHWDKLRSATEYPSFALFEHLFASHLIKCAKPEKESFLFVARALNIQMSECLLVDDTPSNVDRAKAAGWQSLLFRDAAQLKRDLNDLLCY